MTKLGHADDFAGLAAYIRRAKAGGHSVDKVVQSRCGACDGRTFAFVQDEDEGVVERTCTGCGTAAYIADSADHVKGAETIGVCCPCGREQWEIGVGFSLLPDGEVRWVGVGVRCVVDGVVGMTADWKIDYSPSAHLLAKC